MHVVMTSRIEKLSYRGDLGLHGGEVLLSAEPRIDGHHQHHVDEVADMCDGAGRGRGVERNSGGRAGVVDQAERAVEVRAGLGMDDHPGAPGSDVLRDHRVGREHHEVGLEGK